MLHLTISIPRFILNWIKESYGVYCMEHDDSNLDGKDKYEWFKKNGFFRFLAGSPVHLYYPHDRRIENGGYGFGYSWGAYNYKAPTRFLIGLLRIIIIV